MAQDGRKAVVSDHLAVFQGKGADEPAVAVVEIGDGRGAVVFELADLRQVHGVDQRETGQASR